MLDVLVVGAGPVGSFIAWRLSDQGHKVLLLEEHPIIGQPVKCTGIIGLDCLKEFPFMQDLILKSFNQATFYSPSGLRLEVSKSSPQAFLINRAYLDQRLAELAQDAGARIIPQAQVKEIYSGYGKFQILTKVEGKETSFTSKALVLSCGFRPYLLSQLGIKVKEGVIGAQAEVEITDFIGVEVYAGSKIAPGFFAWLVPYLNGKGMAGLLSPQPRLYLEKFLAWLKKESKINCWDRFIYKYLPLQPLAKTYGEGFLIVGEAAGQIKPLTFGGIYYGLLCAQIASESLHQALAKNDLSEQFLFQYQRSWKKLLGQELKISLWARKFYQKLSDGQIDRLFKFALSSDLIDRLLSLDFSFDWHSLILSQLLRGAFWSSIKKVLS